MNVHAFIPARFESTRFPGKPLALIAGKPMIEHVYVRALSCPEVSGVFVATDDERIASCVRGFGGKAIKTAQTHPSGTDRIAEAVQTLPLDEEDLIVNIQGDQPLFEPSVVSELIEPLTEDNQVGMSTLIFRITDENEVTDPKHVKVVADREGYALFFSRSPIPYFRDTKSEKVHYKHLGFYAYRPSFLRAFASLPVGELESAEKLEQLRALEHGFKIKTVETLFDSIEVDTPDDLKRVETMIKRQNADKA
jgi:3-deoxy-manno-octulosonate cytidylyltransferase (CMP-KDO synthetase)